MEGGGREERIGTIPLTGAHIPHREGPEGKGAQVPALPCVSLWARGTRFWRGFPRNRARTLVENGWGRERKADRERERERQGGLFGPYILSSPERVAIISRQWPTDRSASQKDRGPIIAATHRPPRFGRSSSSVFSAPSPPPRPSFLSFFSPPGEFLLPPSRGRRRVEIDKGFSTTGGDVGTKRKDFVTFIER